MRVLVIKTSSLGDVIHTLPALTDAARVIGDITFDWAVEEAFAEIPAWHPAVDQVIPVAIRRWRKQPLESLRGVEWKRCKRALTRHHYDAVIDAQGLIKSAWLSRFVQAPRWGYDNKSAREPLATLAYHHKVPVSWDLHAVERIRHLFAHALRYRVPTETGSYGLLTEELTGNGEKEKTIIGLHGTARDEKLWPEEHWCELASLAAGAGYRVSLPWGSDSEHERAERIAKIDPAVFVLPRLNLKTLAALLHRSSGVVAVDTGLGHLSAALGVPAISMYGPTSPARVGTYGLNQQHIVGGTPQKGSDPVALMAAISPQTVWEQLQPLMAAAA
jgi:heptosyltransferase-1